MRKGGGVGEGGRGETSSTEDWSPLSPTRISGEGEGGGREKRGENEEKEGGCVFHSHTCIQPGRDNTPLIDNTY